MTEKELILQNVEKLSENLWREVLGFTICLLYEQDCIEDAEDFIDVQKALKDISFIPLADVKKELGL